MKSLVCVVIALSAVAAEPPFHRLARFRSARQELAAEKEPTTPRSDQPYPAYPAAGYKPDKEFNLPNQAPATFGAPGPAVSYGAPVLVYRSPNDQDAAKTESVEEVLDHSDESTESSSEEDKDNKDSKSGKLEADSAPVASGTYYVLLPDNRLQLVRYSTQNDLANMAYTARLQYRNEDRAPIYVYSAVPQYTNAAYVQWVR